jgi:hypothetical protein
MGQAVLGTQVWCLVPGLCGALNPRRAPLLRPHPAQNAQTIYATT